MNEQEFQSSLAELMGEISTLPPSERNKLEQLADETRQRHERLKRTVSSLQESLDYLRLSISEQDVSTSLSGTITTKVKSFELQLLDDKLQVVSSLISPKGTYSFSDMPPGTYHLRVLIDTDGDGRWRGGDPDLLRVPEPVYLDPKPQQIRAGFDIVAPIKF